MEGELDNVTRKLIEEALNGNMQAIKLVLDRVLPPKRDRVVDIKLPKLETPKDAVKAISTIVDALGRGNITPTEGEAISRVVDAFVKSIQTYDIEKRICILEQQKATAYDKIH